MDFKTYLRTKGITTTDKYCRSLENIKQLLIRDNVEIDTMTYSDVMQYIDRRKRMQVSVRTINHDLMVLRRYMEYLQLMEVRNDSPLKGVKVHGALKHRVSDLLDEKQLENIYDGYKRDDVIGIRNKVIVGLLVYQGLKTNEIEALRLSHINLDSCTVYIPETVKSNSREISLYPKQLIPLMKYIGTVRAEISAKASDKLIISAGNGQRIMNALAKLLKELPVTNYKQIRTSVISNRLTADNLREQQVYFGFKYISSIEPYLRNRVDDLKSGLDECFPI